MLLDLPKLGPVQFDDNLSPDELSSQLDQLAKKYNFELPRGELGFGEMTKKSLMRGAKQIGSTFGDIIPAMAAKAVGADEYAARQMEEAAETQKEINKYYAPQYRELGDVKGISDVPGFALETFLENAPNIATSLVPGVGAEVLAARMGAGAAGRIAAQNAGVFLGSYAQNAPEVFQNIYDKTGQMEPGAALLWGSASAALDSVLPAQLLKSVTGPVKVGIVEKLLERSGMDKGLVRSIAANVLKDAGYEGLTEGAQEAISISAEKFIANNPQVFDSDDWKRIVESSVRGSVAGGPFGAYTGSVETAREGQERKSQYEDALQRRAERLQAAENRATGATLEELQASQAQGTLPGFELGAASSLMPTPIETAETKELKGKQGSLFDENGIPTKEAEASKAKADKAEANRTRAAQNRLKTLLKAKQADLDLQPAPPVGGVETEGQPDLFGAAPVAEPTKVQKPAALTPSTLGTIIGKDKTSLREFGKTLGIGPTAGILREDGPLAGKDLSNPADAAEVRRILEAYANGKPAPSAPAKIEEYLKRPEFQIQETQNGDGIRSGLIPGASEPSVPGAGEAVQDQGFTGGTSQFVEQGVGVPGQPAAPAVSGEGTVERPLGVKEAKDLSKAEAAVDPAVEAQQQFVRQVEDNIGERLISMLPAGIDFSWIKDSNAFKLFRVAPLIQEYTRLKEVIAKAADRNQKVKNAKELQVIRDAILESGPDMAPVLRDIDTNPNRAQGYIDAANKAGRDDFQQNVRKEQEKNKPVQATATPVNVALDQEVQAEEIAQKFVSTNIAKAVQSGKVDSLIDEAIASETNPEVKAILQKVKKMGLKTKVKQGKVSKKAGTLGAENAVGEYDPATDTITLDPELGLTTHNAIHELVHAAISHVLRNPNHPLTKQLTAIYENVYNQLGSAYGAQDIQEFAAELSGNPEFREALKGIKAPKGGNMLQRIIQHIAEFFGFRKGQSAYDAAIKALNDILDVAPTEPKSTGEQMFNIIQDAREAMPGLTKNAIESAKNTFSNLEGTDWKVLGLNVMRLDQINKIWGDKLPAIQTLINNLELRKGFIERSIKRIAGNYKTFNNTFKKYRGQFNRMQDIAYDARLNKVGRLDQGFKAIPVPAKASPKRIAEINALNTKRKAKYDELHKIYTQLPTDVKTAYTTILNDYKSAFEKYKEIMFNSTDDLSLKQKIKARFEEIEHVDGYIPFLRRGDYWVRYIDPATGEDAASAFESKREREMFIKNVLKGADHTVYRKLENAKFDPKSIPTTNFIHQVIKGLEAKGASRDQIDNVYQSYLALFPAESISKQFMHAKGTPGMERDILRGYADTMIKWSRKLGDSMYAPAIDDAVEEIRSTAESSGDDNLIAVGRNISSQQAFFHNPTFDNFVHGATALSYFEYITGNISSALVNLTSLPLLVFPILGGRFGFTRTAYAMRNAHDVAWQWAIKTENKSSKYAALYDKLLDHAQLEHTMAREVLEGRRQSTEDYTGLKARVMDGLSVPFSATERYNRAVTAIAAYDLAKENGFSEDKALQFALDTVKDAHTSGMAETAPKWMQNPIGRMFFTFKSFTWNSAFIIAKSFHDSFKGESKEIRAAARRQLLGTYFMASMFGGVNGLPFLGLYTTIAQMLHALFGDDEPYDPKEDLRAFFGEMLYKGPVNYITNLEVSNRVGLAQDLIWRDDPRASSGFVLGAMQRAFGPAGSYLVNVEHAYDMFNQGHTERAIEAVLPSFIRNGLKGSRYMVEGARTLKGDPIEEDVEAYNSLMQVIGFSPASLSSKYEKTSSAKSYETEVKNLRQRLLDKYEMGRVGSDSDLMAEAKEDIAKFNQSHPKDRITGETLTRSQAARKAAEKNTVYGVTFNKHLMPEIKEKFFNE